MPCVPDVSADQFQKSLRFHVLKLPACKTLIPTTKVTCIMIGRWLLLALGLAASGCDDAKSMLDSCISLRAEGSYEAAEEACVKAAGVDSDAGRHAASLVPEIRRDLQKARRELKARENSVPERITEAWCDKFASRFYERALAGLVAEESKKKYSRRKTRAYMERIVSDDANVKRIYCKDHAGERTEGYYACMYRADYSGYRKCEEEEKARDRAEILAEQKAREPHPTPSLPPASTPRPDDVEWDTVGETTVTGSSTLNCETKVLGGSFRARCEANGLGAPKSVTLLRGVEEDSTATLTGKKLVFTHPYNEGANFAALFVWADGERLLKVQWPEGTSRPAITGQFQKVGLE